MVKLFGREWGVKASESISVERGKSLLTGSRKTELKEYRADVETNREGYMVYKPKYVMDFYDKYFDRDLIRAPVDDLAESAFGAGYYTSTDSRPSDMKEGRRSSSFKSKELIDDFGKYYNMDDWLVNIGKNLLIAGFLPVETRLIAGPVDKNALKLIHPTTVKEVWLDKYGEINRLIQKVGNAETSIDGKYLAWFTYGQVGNDPFGVSYIRGLLPILDTLDRATENVDAILEQYIAPVGIWKQRQGRSLEALKKAVVEREPGEDIFLGDLTQEELTEKIVEFISIDPRVPFWDYITYLDRRIYAYTRSNNLFYSKDATVASAETLYRIVLRHVAALQRCVKRGVERFWFTPLVQLNFGESAEVPRLNFGVERTGVEDIQVEPFLTKGLEVGYIDQVQYSDLLAQLGLKLKPPQSKPEAATPLIPEPEVSVKEPDAAEEALNLNLDVNGGRDLWLVKRLRADAQRSTHG